MKPDLTSTSYSMATLSTEHCCLAPFYTLTGHGYLSLASVSYRRAESATCQSKYAGISAVVDAQMQSRRKECILLIDLKAVLAH